MATSVNPPKATLKAVLLKRLVFNQPSDVPGKGQVTVENSVNIFNFDEEGKSFQGSLMIKIESQPNKSGEEGFNALSEWVCFFELNRKSKEETILKHTEYYLNHCYPVARSFVVDTLLKMGVSLNQLPWEANPKQ